MQRFRFPLAVAVTSIVLVVGVFGVAGLLVGNALASGPWTGWHDGHDFQLPPQLAGLRDVPAGERFSHFRGVQVSLTDKDNKPLNVTVTPGTATATSPTSLTIAGNDGSTRTFSLNDQTAIRGKSAIAPNDHVVVVTLDNSTTATAVMAGDFGPRGPFGH
jgi:hypothetical protein